MRNFYFTLFLSILLTSNTFSQSGYSYVQEFPNQTIISNVFENSYNSTNGLAVITYNNQDYGAYYDEVNWPFYPANNGADPVLIKVIVPPGVKSVEVSGQGAFQDAGNVYLTSLQTPDNQFQYPGDFGTELTFPDDTYYWSQFNTAVNFQVTYDTVSTVCNYAYVVLYKQSGTYSNLRIGSLTWYFVVDNTDLYEQWVNNGMPLPGTTTNISQTEYSPKLNIFPNPAKNYINIKNIDLKVNNLEIIDFSGKVIKQIQLNSENTQVDISNLENGLYVIKAGNETIKFIKE